MPFNLNKFLLDVFDPEQGETAVVMVDLPHGSLKDNDDWRGRRDMAEEWHRELVNIASSRKFEVLPMLAYPATGANGAPLPSMARLGGKEICFDELFKKVTLVVALTEFSATAPLAGFAEELPRFRAASMPRVTKSMEKTGFAADYREMQRRCAELKAHMEGATGLEVSFSTGHRCRFDLRYRRPSVDDGLIDKTVFGKKGDAVLNLPGGEVFEAPYEGEKGEPSRTAGELPVMVDGELAVFVVEANKVVDVRGEGGLAAKWRAFIGVDRGRRNIAEVAFGCNEKADPNGAPIEAEKTAFHWAIGESSHLGGVFGEKDFDDPANACHDDFVYAGRNEVKIKEAALIVADNARRVVIKDNRYVV